ncbi:MAG: diaminopimelate epimerase [Jatrophihabitantaceae bacterium]
MTDQPTGRKAAGRSGLSVIKGHGTENDFLIIPDLEGVLSLSPALVRALCDRHAGIGADGVLRLMRTKLATEPDVRSQADEAEFFMDYRNADGSIVEMCGNGVRVVGRFLQQAGLAGDVINLATRGGIKVISFDGDDVTVAMGTATVRPEHPTVNGRYAGLALDLPNPHVVVELASEQELAELDLTVPPVVDPALPDGQNVEFFVRGGPNQVRMRVHERGVGETRSCGTGICAVAVAATGDLVGAAPVQVQVPGGRCTVGWAADGSITLSGPAVLVGEVAIGESWLNQHR